jgi:rhodanese-related sulfurtransferase
VASGGASDRAQGGGQLSSAARRRAVLCHALVACTLVAGCAASRPSAKASDGFDPRVARRISIDELKQRMAAGDAVTVIDVRPVLHGNMADGADHVPPALLPRWAREHDQNAFVVAYCTCHKEATSARAVLELQALGYTNAWALVGSLDAWEQAGLPTRDVPRR